MTLRSHILPAVVVASVSLAAIAGCNRAAPDAGGAQPPAASGGTAPAASRSASGGSAGDGIAWLPGDQPLAGWKRARAPQMFGPDDLWEAINGAAETYLSFGFKELTSLPCQRVDGSTEATIEVYRMADARSAFGIYAQERNPGARFLELGAEGYASANVVNFWSGPNYIKLTGASAGDDVVRGLLELARAISDRIGPPPPVPDMLTRLPAAGQVAHSLKYVPKDVLGQSDLVNAVEAQYAAAPPNAAAGDSKKGATWRLVCPSFATAEEATSAFDRYQKFVAASGAVRAIPAPGDAGFVGNDKYNGRVVAVRAGTTIAIVLGAPSERVATDLIAKTLGSK